MDYAEQLIEDIIKEQAKQKADAPKLMVKLKRKLAAEDLREAEALWRQYG